MIQQDHVEVAAEGEVVSKREAPRRVQLIILPQESSVISMNVRHGHGPGMLLTLLIRLLLLLLSRKTLNMPSLRPVRLAYQPAVLFSQNEPATSNQPTVLFSQNKPAPAISHQPTEQAADPNWVNAMHEELENFERNQVWELVESPPLCKW
jgi:hypothetical protein